MKKEGLPDNQSKQNDIETTKAIEQIKIPRLALREPVTITGTDVFGRPAQVTLEPTEESGWFWQIDGKDVPLSMNMLQSDSHNYLKLKYDKSELCVCEHLLPLRFAGVDGVRIVAKTKWLPYDGGGNIFWKAVENKLHYDGALRPIQQPVKGEFSKTEKSGLHRLVSIDNADPTKLIVNVNVDYKKFGGAYNIVRSFPLPSPDKMIDLFTSKPLGSPAWSGYLLKIASQFGWPHYNGILWPKKGDNPEEILRKIALHRMFDFLGAMAVIPKSGEYLMGDLFSDCGNHASDAQLIRSIEKLFVEKGISDDVFVK